MLTDVTDRVRRAEHLALDELASAVGRSLAESTRDNHAQVVDDCVMALGRHFNARGVALAEGSGLQGSDRRPTMWCRDDPTLTEPELNRILETATRHPTGTIKEWVDDRGLMGVSVPAEKHRREGMLCLLLERTKPLSEHEHQTLSSVARSLATNGVRIEAQIYFGLAFDDAPVGISIRRMDSTLLAANQAYADLLGYESPDDMIGRPAEAILKRNSLDLAMGIPKVVTERGEVRRLKASFARKDGSVAEGLVQAKVVEGLPGDEPLILSHVEDITVAVERERLLEASQQRFANLVENSPAITVLTDPQLRVTYVSPSIGQLGWTEAGPAGFEPPRHAP